MGLFFFANLSGELLEYKFDGWYWMLVGFLAYDTRGLIARGALIILLVIHCIRVFHDSFSAEGDGVSNVLADSPLSASVVLLTYLGVQLFLWVKLKRDHIKLIVGQANVKNLSNEALIWVCAIAFALNRLPLDRTFEAEREHWSHGQPFSFVAVDRGIRPGSITLEYYFSMDWFSLIGNLLFWIVAAFVVVKSLKIVKKR